MNKVPVDRATPHLTEPTRTPEEMVTAGNEAIPNILASTNIGVATDVKNNATAWATANAALDANNKAKAKARADLAAAEIAEPPLVRRWFARRDATLTSINVFGDGSKQVVQTFNVGVEERSALPLATTPANLRPMKEKKPTLAGVRWNPTVGAHGYLLQHATNPADATTYSAQIALTAARYYLAGQVSGTTVYFRVLACDKDLPNGQSAYTAWVAVVVT